MTKKKKFIKDNNFINIQGWMITSLGLKGNQLLVFACIHGFTQDKENWFEGTQAYLAEWCSTSKKCISQNLKELCEAKLLIKEETYIKGIKMCKYKINFPQIEKICAEELEETAEIENNYKLIDEEEKNSIVENFFPYYEKNNSVGREKSSPNNKINNKNNNINLPSFYPSKDQWEKLSKNKKDGEKEKTELYTPLSSKELYWFTRHITKKQIGYNDFKITHPENSELISEILDIIVDVKCSNLKTIRIGQEEKTIEIIKSQFNKLRYEHIEQVIENLDNNISKIRNFKSYIITSLYNSLFTLHYQKKAEFNYLYNKGKEIAICQELQKEQH